MFNINDVNSYQIKFKEFCNKQMDALSNTINNIKTFHINDGSGLFDILFNMLKDEDVELIHASRILDINSIKEYGVLNPNITPNIVNIILNPIQNKISDELFKNVKENLSREIIKNNKYNKIYFAVGDIKDINLENDFLMLNKYGGELLEVIFSLLNFEELYYDKIAKLGKPYAIFFKEKISKLYESNKYFVEEIFSFIILKYCKNIYAKMFKTSYIYENIEARNILNIFEINMEEIN